MVMYRFDQYTPISHAGELEYVFDNFKFTKATKLREDLSRAMEEYWISFVRHHAPVSATAAITWPKAAAKPTSLVFNTQKDGLNITVDGVWSACPLWDSVGYV